MSTSRYIEIRPDNIPADGKISFKNGFPVLSFTISSQDGLLDPSTIRVVGDFAAYKDNLATPTPLTDGDFVSMNNRLGIYNVIESLSIRAGRSKMVCESIRHYSKFMNTYMAMTSSLQDQMGHLGQTCLIHPNATAFRKSVVESPAGATVPQTNSFSFHLPCGFVQSGQMVNLRPDAFGGVTIEMLLQPDSNVLFNASGITTGIGDAHYELSNLKMTCEVSDIPEGQLQSGESEGVYQYNTITSLYTSINSTNAQLQYNLGLRNVQSAFMTFVPVADINTLTADGQVTVQLSGDGSSKDVLAPIRRVQWLKGGQKYPADFDYVSNIVDSENTASSVVDPSLIKNLIDAVSPDYSNDRISISPVNCNRNYDMAESYTSESSYLSIADGGSVYGLGVSYGIGGAGEDFSLQQWGVSIESDLKSDRPMGVYLFIKAKAALIYSPQGVQLQQ
tara:strand:- start:124 stop:1467 length:1344 start_codon:yes stop_codon:yes gene_type:complete